MTNHNDTLPPVSAPASAAEEKSVRAEIGASMRMSDACPGPDNCQERIVDLRERVIALTQQLTEAQTKYDNAEFWKDWVYPEGATAQQVQDELTDYRMVMENVSEVYAHISHSRISKVNTLAFEVIAVADDLEREAIEDETKDLQEQLDEAEAELTEARRAGDQMRETLTNIDNLRNATKIKVKGDPLDMTPDEYIDVDGFATLPYGVKRGLMTAANMARDALAALAASAQSERREEGR